MYQKTCIALHQALYCIKRDSEVYKYICSCNPVKYYHFQVKKKVFLTLKLRLCHCVTPQYKRRILVCIKNM